jgi:ATP-binding cassette subfamily B protein
MNYEGAVQTVGFLSMALFLFVGAQQVMNGEMTIGAMVAFNSLVAMASAPILTLLSMWDNWQLSAVLLNRMNDIFESQPEQGYDHSHLMPVSTLEGSVRLQGVGFQYGGPDSPKILDSISIDIPAGTTVAIVGRSGSGKTTLVKCLAGLLEPTEGEIYFDGVEQKKLRYRDLRQQIGFVLQENYLFDDTIAKNTAFGDEEPDLQRVTWAAKVANAHEFIERLPLGYDTRVGETGIALSEASASASPCASPLQQPTYPDLRRSDQRPGYRVGEGRQREHGSATNRSNFICHRASAEHDSRRRFDSGHRKRKDR